MINSSPIKSHRVGYAYSANYTKLNDLLPSNIGRASLIDDLIRAYNLLPNCDIIAPSFASKLQLCSYHDQDFIAFLLGEEIAIGDNEEDDKEDDKEDDLERRLEQRYGVEFDCPVFSGLDKYIQALAGTTIACARYVSQRQESLEKQKIAINWHGGRHHAGKDQASGFCYVNDIVLGILEYIIISFII